MASNFVQTELLPARQSPVITDLVPSDPVASGPSWPFRLFAVLVGFVRRAFGAAILIFLLAIVASIPVLQVLSIGYLLEVTGRVGRSGKMRRGLVGLDKASRIGGIVLGTWLCLLPIQLATALWYGSYLIDPASMQTAILRGVQVTLVVLMVAHIVAAWFCGGRLRYFFWPLIAPFSLSLWAARGLAKSPSLRPVLEKWLAWVSPRLVADIGATRPLDDWFLPVIVWKNLRGGTWYTAARDGVWSFVVGLRLPYYFWLGLRGLAGTLLWLLVPTLLLISSTTLLQTDLPDGLVGLLAVVSIGVTTLVFALLPMAQAHFAMQRRMRCFFQLATIWRAVRSAPLAYLLAVLVIFLFGAPLFLFDIERVPNELFWALGVFYVVLIWPGKMMSGWAYARSQQRSRPVRWFFSLPALGICLPVTFAFTVILFFTRYVSWSGNWSLIENHVFLLPTPFWLI